MNIFNKIIFLCITFYGTACVTKKMPKEISFGGIWGHDAANNCGKDTALNPLQSGVKLFKDEQKKIETKNIPINLLIRKFKTRNLSDSCDIIFLNNGDEVFGKVLEITLTEVKYKRCDNLNGPLISISKSDVFMVKYPNGKKDVIKSPEPPKKSEVINKAIETPPQNEGIIFSGGGAIGCLIGLFGIFAPLPIFLLTLFGLASMILGITSLVSIAKSNGTKKGTFFAVVSIILGMFILGVLVLLTL